MASKGLLAAHHSLFAIRYSPLPCSHTASADSSGQPMARLARRAASPPGSAASQRAAVMRWPEKLSEAADTSQRVGGPMMSGRSILSRGQPDASEMSGVSVGPPGTSTLTVMPLPSSSLAHTADRDSNAALAAP